MILGYYFTYCWVQGLGLLGPFGAFWEEVRALRAKVRDAVMRVQEPLGSVFFAVLKEQVTVSRLSTKALFREGLRMQRPVRDIPLSATTSMSGGPLETRTDKRNKFEPVWIRRDG